MKPLGENDPRKLGPYTIEQLIDKGGMARVYLGRSPSGKPVAVKLMNDLDDPRARERFQREFRLAQIAKNPYLVNVLDQGNYGDMLWYASEYVPGSTLQAVINQSAGRGLGEEAATVMAHVLCSVLATIHSKGITHRDLKPANIILGENGPRIIDFGIAHMHGHTLTDSLIWESSGYIAPERFIGGTPQASWDIFAMGVIIAHMASGHMPFPNESREQNMRAVLDFPPDLDGVPLGLLPFVRRCLDKNPAVRSDVRTVRHELGGIMQDEVRTLDWLPDYIATEVIKETRRLKTLAYTQPATKPVQRTPAPQPVRRTAPPKKSGGGGVVATLIVLGLLVFGGIKLGPDVWAEFNKPHGGTSQPKKTTQTPVDPSRPLAAKFTVSKKALGRAYDRADPTNSVTITKVTPHGYSLVLNVLTNDYNGIQTKAFQDSCVKIVTAKWSGVQYVNDFTIDFDSPTKAGTTKGTMTVYLDIPGRYVFLPNCADEKSVVGMELGTNSVKNLGFLSYNGDPLPIRAAYRSGENAVIVIPDNPVFDTSLLCVKTPRGPVPVSSATKQAQNDDQYAIVTFEQVPKGSKLYFSPCDGANYQGSSFALP